MQSRMQEAMPQGVRARVAAFVESPPVQRFVIAVIVLNAVILGMDTSPVLRASIGSWLSLADAACLAIFVVELGLKLWGHGPRFFRSGWNVFDLLVVGIALVPASGPLAVLRALRVLRVLRLASAMPRLRFVVEALLAAIPGIGAIAGLMLILFYVAAVIANSLFGEAFPQWFGSLGGAFYTLFQVMTLDSWSSGMVRPVMEVYPWAWAFFVPFVLIATFTMLNLFIAIIVNTMQALHDRGEAVSGRDGAGDEVFGQGDLDGLRAEIRLLRQELSVLRGAVGVRQDDSR